MCKGKQFIIVLIIYMCLMVWITQGADGLKNMWEVDNKCKTFSKLQVALCVSFLPLKSQFSLLDL